MSDSNNDAQITITADTSGLSSALDDAAGSIASFSSHVSGQFGSVQSSFNSLMSGFSAAGSATSGDVTDQQQEQLDKAAAQQKKLLLEQGVRDQQSANKEALADDQITNQQYLQNKLALQQQLDAIDMQAAQEKQAADSDDVVKAAQDGNMILALKQKQATEERAIQQQLVQAQEKDQLQLASQINTSFASAVNSVVTGSKTMGQAFTQFATGVINDIAKIAEKDVISAIFGAGTGASGTGGGLGGSIAGLFSSATSFAGFRASGGDVAAGQGYVVGENGPEYFMPSQGGSILNQSQMGKMGANNVTVQMNVTTPNASSFRQNAGQMMADMQAQIRKSAARNS